MGRRRQQRFKKGLTVEIHGTDSLGQPFSQTASVMDVSESGVRLQEVQVLYRAGLTVVLEHQGNKAQYRVVWIGAGALAGQAGLANLEPQKSIFNLNFPPSGPDKYVLPPPGAREFDSGLGRFDDGLRRLVEQRRRAERRKDERRQHIRQSCSGDAEIYVGGTRFPQRGRLTDLSRGGCFVELLPAITLDTKVTLVLLIAQRNIRVEGVVKSVLPNFGLGIQFLHLEPKDLQQLDEVLAALEHGTSLAATPSSAPAPAASPAATTVVDPPPALEAVRSWFVEHSVLTREQFLDLLKNTPPKGQ
jgi:hypothetical protein